MPGSFAQSSDPVLVHMRGLLDRWEPQRDHRAVFLGCYAMMTGNMIQAVQDGEFHDAVWVRTLLENFADYYFKALEVYDSDLANTPPAWKIAFDAGISPQVKPLQLLLLGVNAHINYDLVFCLSDMLEPEWSHLAPADREKRYADHCRVNHVIARTVDVVQDEILERYTPALDVVDKMMGRLDEFIIDRMISAWREKVWQYAIRWVEDPQESTRRQLRKDIEGHALHYANLFSLHGPDIKNSLFTDAGGEGVD